MSTIAASAAPARAKAALTFAVRPGPGRAAARHRARHGRPRFCGQPEDPQRRLPEAISMIVRRSCSASWLHGIAGAGDLKKVGRVGVKALVYFETMTTVALVVGLLLAYLSAPATA